MNITIVGGGNVGTQFAVHCAEKKHEVLIYTSRPQKFAKEIYVVDKEKKVKHVGKIAGATDNPEVAFGKADIIFVTVPAYCMDKMAGIIFPYVTKNTKIGIIPGTGGGECAFKRCLEKGAVIFGLQRVPSVARLVEYGRTVCATGYRDALHVATIPAKEAGECVKILQSIFDIPCHVISDYLNLTLTPSNPILHTTRLKTIFKEYTNGLVYDSLPLFYEHWDNETSELLLKCDDEVQQICRALNAFNLGNVKSLRIHYESETVEQMTAKISSIQGFKGLTTPSIKVDNGYIPDLNSRYFVADFSYGLSIIKQIADFANVEVPNITEVLLWYKKIAISGIKEFLYSDYNINTYEDFVNFYCL